MYPNDGALRTFPGGYFSRSSALVDAVKSIQAGNVGSALPAGVSQATVAVQVEPSDRSLGTLELRAIEIIA